MAWWLILLKFSSLSLLRIVAGLVISGSDPNFQSFDVEISKGPWLGDC